MFQLLRNSQKHVSLHFRSQFFFYFLYLCTFSKKKSFSERHSGVILSPHYVIYVQNDTFLCDLPGRKCRSSQQVLLPHCNGKFSNFPFQPFGWAGESQKLGPPLREHETSGTSEYQFVYAHLSFFGQFCLQSYKPQSRALLTSNPAANYHSTPKCLVPFALLSPHSPGRHLQLPSLQSLVGQRKGFTLHWLNSSIFSEVKLKFSWKRNIQNINKRRKFLCRNKTVNLSIPN